MPRSSVSIWRFTALRFARATMFSIIAPLREVLEVEDLALALGVRDLEEFVLVSRRVHVVDARPRTIAVRTRWRHPPSNFAEHRSRAAAGSASGTSRKISLRGLRIRALDLDLEVEAARAAARPGRSGPGGSTRRPRSRSRAPRRRRSPTGTAPRPWLPCPELMPLPRMRNSESISSKKITTGTSSRASRGPS